MTKAKIHSPNHFAKALTAILLTGALAAPAAFAQVCGDVTADSKITSSDALKVLKAAVGQPVALVCQDQCAALEPRIAALEDLLAHVTVVGNNMVLTGMNLQIVSGSGTTNGTVNGTGNIIIGYDESNSNKDKKTGSHDLVIGRYHSYSAYGSIIAGEDNEASTGVASVLGGAQNKASGAGAVVVGGQKNLADGETAVVVAGELNHSSGLNCAIASGAGNVCSGQSGAVSGGFQNLCSGNGSAIGGGSNRSLNSNVGWLAGSLGPVF